MGFDDLTPALRVQIATELGWTSLRPVQEQAIDAILPGHHAVILAPTAGGKTEASLFPVLSRMVDEDWPPVSVLYLAPIRALLNNQEARLTRLTGLVGRRAAKWHGDVNAAVRRQILDAPPDVLAITPESVEALLLSTSRPGKRLLGNVRTVIIDEVHAFAGDDRGAHLMCLLERLTHVGGRSIQRIGLSATVGDPDEIADWLRGSSPAPAVVVDPGGGTAAPVLRIDHVGDLENAGLMIDRLFPGTRRLVFADSRRSVEALGDVLRQRGVDTFVSHSSLAMGQRQRAEQAFAEGTNCAIVATSALELGLDVGELDHVVQIDAPATVSSFLQRMGRTGRRPGTVPNCTFLCRKDTDVLHAAALLRLRAQGFVEPAAPTRHAPHILAHQLMALALQEHGVPIASWQDHLAGAAPLRDVTDAERNAILDHMLGEGLLLATQGRYAFGEEAQTHFGKRNLMEMYAVFSTPPELRVFWGGREIGTIDAWFAQQDEHVTFVLAGRRWRIVGVQWKKRTCTVQPADDARLPRWTGGGRVLSYEVCQAMRQVLISDDDDPWWTQRARNAIHELRAVHDFLRDEPMPLVADGAAVRWHTWSGGKRNALYAALLRAELGDTVSSNNLTVRFTGDAARSDAAIHEAIAALREPGALSLDRAVAHLPKHARARLSKFQRCLPEAVEAQWVAEGVFGVG